MWRSSGKAGTVFFASFSRLNGHHPLKRAAPLKWGKIRIFWFFFYFNNLTVCEEAPEKLELCFFFNFRVAGKSLNNMSLCFFQRSSQPPIAAPKMQNFPERIISGAWLKCSEKCQFQKSISFSTFHDFLTAAGQKFWIWTSSCAQCRRSVTGSGGPITAIFL